MKDMKLFPVVAALLLTVVLAPSLSMAHAATVDLAAAGDFSCGSEGKKTVTKMKSAEPDLLAFLGDLSYASSEKCFLNQLSGLDKATLAIIVGNHDAAEDGSAKNTKEITDFTGKKTFYRMNDPTGKVDLFVLDTQQKLGRDTPQYNWLAGELANSDAWYKVVAFHKPAASCTCKHSPSGLYSVLQELFVANHVDLVLQGHNHNYQRFTQTDGVVWILVGTGGKSSYTLKTPSDEFPVTARAFDKTNGFLKLAFAADSTAVHEFSGTYFSNKGAIKDEFKISNQAPGPAPTHFNVTVGKGQASLPIDNTTYKLNVTEGTATLPLPNR